MLVQWNAACYDFHDIFMNQNDVFAETVFNNIDSILARERKSDGIAHANDKYATEKNSLMILNLAMIFIQHCI